MAVGKPEEMHRAFTEAFNSGDLESLMALYEAGAAIVPQPGQQPVAGAQTIREVLKGFLAAKGRINLETKSVTQAGDIALLRANWRLTFTGPDGKAIEMSHSSMEVLRRQPDGTWRYVIDHPFGAD